MSPERKERKFSRRKFFTRGGILVGGTMVACYAGCGPTRRYMAKIAGEVDMPSGVLNFKPAFWFEIDPESKILLKSPKVEMGQGVFTGLAMMAVEELNVDLQDLEVVHASTANGPADLAGTGGSTSTAALYDPVREVAATLRVMLTEAAAKLWSVDPGDISIRGGKVKTATQELALSQLVKDWKEWEVPKTPPLKDKNEFRYIGKSIPRVDLKPKVMGHGIFGLDAEMPDMLYGSVLYCTHIQGELESVDTADASVHPGVVKIVEGDQWVGVIARSRYAAEMGKRKLKANWKILRQWQQKDIEEIITVGNGKKVVVQKKGNVKKQFDSNSDQLITNEYRTPLGAHAHLEPNGCIADFKDGKLKVIMGTQVAASVQMQVASALGIKRKNIEIEVAYLGGGFGRRYFNNNVVEAALMSKAVGKPVSFFMDRQQEFQNGYCRPNTHHRLEASLLNGKINGIKHDQATGDMMLDNMPIPGIKLMMGADFISAGHGVRILYPIENRLATMWQSYLPFQTGIWRGVGMFANSFAVESFLDEVAIEAGRDPLQFRLDHLNSEEEIIIRQRKVLEATAAKAGWSEPKAEGIGRGIACAEDRQTVVATVVEVQLIEDQIRVTRVTQGIDPGCAINPEGIRMQVEGATMMAISASLYEELMVKDGQLAATNYHQYPMASLKDTPEIEVVILENRSIPSGVGEPPIAPVAPAIANAIFDLTGQRLRSLPLRLA